VNTALLRVAHLSIAVVLVAVAWPDNVGAQPVIVRAYTDAPYFDLVPGQRVNIIFTVDANGADISAITFPLKFTFGGQNIIGPIEEYGPDTAATFSYSSYAQQVFENRPFNLTMAQDFTDNPDTLLWGALDFDGNGWTGSGEFCRITLEPADTGTVIIEPTLVAPAGGGYIMVLDQYAAELPVDWEDAVLSFPQKPGAVQIAVRTSYDNDSLYLGGRGAIVFNVDWAGNEIAAISYSLGFNFSNGNVIGPISETPIPPGAEFAYSAYAKQVFESLPFNENMGQDFTDGFDTLLFGAIDFGSGGWRKNAELARISFTPTDTGVITIDSFFMPPASTPIGVLDVNANELPFIWSGATITAAPCPVLMGDVNVSGEVNSSDLIYYVNYIFKSGPEPQPRRESGDVNCTGGLTGGDIIYLVNYMFKGGPAPCTCFGSKI